jgi:hypothetical protein
LKPAPSVRYTARHSENDKLRESQE